MKKTQQWIIGFLLVLLAPISAKAQWSFDVGSVEAFINDTSNSAVYYWHAQLWNTVTDFYMNTVKMKRLLIRRLT